jgi:hypothetical protein
MVFQVLALPPDTAKSAEPCVPAPADSSIGAVTVFAN